MRCRDPELPFLALRRDREPEIHVARPLLLEPLECRAGLDVDPGPPTIVKVVRHRELGGVTGSDVDVEAGGRVEDARESTSSAFWLYETITASGLGDGIQIERSDIVSSGLTPKRQPRR